MRSGEAGMERKSEMGHWLAVWLGFRKGRIGGKGMDG